MIFLKFNTNAVVGDLLRGRSIKSSLIHGLTTSGLSGVWRTLAVGLLGSSSEVADVYITNQETGEKISLAWVPEKISVKESAQFQSYNIIERGEVKVPKGKHLSAVSWEAVFPGESRTEDSFIKSENWEAPTEIIQRLQAWQNAGNKLNLLITQTPVNLDVFLQSLDYSFEGGMGDAKYSISFIAAEDLLIKTVEEVDAEKAKEKESGIPELESRAALPKPSSIKSVLNQTLWSIAEQKLGSGARWLEVYAANAKKLVDVDALIKTGIKAGIKIKLPF